MGKHEPKLPEFMGQRPVLKLEWMSDLALKFTEVILAAMKMIQDMKELRLNAVHVSSNSVQGQVPPLREKASYTYTFF